MSTQTVCAKVVLCHSLHLNDFPPNAFSNESSISLPEKKHSHIGCIVLLFPTVRFQMSPQTACPRGCIVTLVAFVRLFSAVRYQMTPQIAFPRISKVTFIALFYFSPLCVFKCLLKFSAREEAKSHWLHLFGFSPLCVFK